MESTIEIYIDIDGVLADFVGGAIKIHNKDESILEEFEGSYDIASVFGMTEEDFWKHINDDIDNFYSNLKPTEECKEIIDAVVELKHRNDIDVEISVITSRHESLKESTTNWLYNNIPPLRGHRLIFNENKSQFAKPNAILIDDSDEQLLPFITQGGNIIPIHRPWNYFVTSAVDVRKDLEMIVDSILSKGKK